ncbi:hypothetical protein [Ruegeria halocynthiae]|uniref:hypothetical protein n=1 Tax=Ruegeria halocynthiae TaxID=985054 RepID=UPI0005660D7B|nr:hypothetical protein [Ruegeria halocynthiae]
MDIDKENYPGGFYALMRHLERKEVPYLDSHLALPGADVDLDDLSQARVNAPDPEAVFENRRDARRKLHDLQLELAGSTQLHLVHALCIALLRRRPAPPEARALFFRMWKEKGAELAQDLPVRWLISSATTFADHGETMDQRLGGQGLSMLFDLIKLHDSERRISLQPNDQGFRAQGNKHSDVPLAFDMGGYSLPSGDLDRNMLARLWRYAENDPVLRPLGVRMLKMVMYDRRSIFGRIQKYKGRQSIMDYLPE